MSSDKLQRGSTWLWLGAPVLSKGEMRGDCIRVIDEYGASWSARPDELMPASDVRFDPKVWDMSPRIGFRCPAGPMPVVVDALTGEEVRS